MMIIPKTNAVSGVVLGGEFVDGWGNGSPMCGRMSKGSVIEGTCFEIESSWISM